MINQNHGHGVLLWVILHIVDWNRQRRSSQFLHAFMMYKTFISRRRDCKASLVACYIILPARQVKQKGAFNKVL